MITPSKKSCVIDCSIATMDIELPLPNIAWEEERLTWRDLHNRLI
jgi:hypothetical protein